MKSCHLRGHTRYELEPRVLQSSGGVNCDHKADHASRYVEEVDLKFLEEPCGLTAEQGFGYAQPQIGERVGIGRTYDHEILRKVGWGMYSSVWLAKDYSNDRFVAIKILTGHATKVVGCRMSAELNVMLWMERSYTGKNMRETHCLLLLGEFLLDGKDPGEGREHQCFITGVLGPSVAHFRQEYREYPIVLSKKILRDVLTGLIHLHDIRIVHTDLQSRNIMIDLGEGESAFDIESYIKEEPARRYPPERTWGVNKYTQVAMSQPFPSSQYDHWMSRSFVIGDLGSAQFRGWRVNDIFSPLHLRAPEVTLDLPWDEKVDIWSVGCLAFELIANRDLFTTYREGWDSEEFVLYQILMLAEERLPVETIRSSKRALRCLDPDTGWFKDGSPSAKRSLSVIVKEVGNSETEDHNDGFEAFLRKCLRLNPRDRPSAKELLEDPWLNTET